MKSLAFAFLAFMSLCLSPLTSSAETLDEPTMKAKLSEIIGDKTLWNIPAMKDFKRNANCEDVKKVLTTLTCDPTKYDFPKVAVDNNPLISGYKFSFDKGKLYAVTVLFHRHLDKDLFKKVSLELGEAKWGALKPEKRDGDILTWVNSSFDIVQRTYFIDHWEIKVVAPK